jgi:hypothetical protein
MLTALMILLACFYGLIPATLDFGPLLLAPPLVDLTIGMTMFLAWDKGPLPENKLSIKSTITYCLIFSWAWGFALVELLKPAPATPYTTDRNYWQR